MTNAEITLQTAIEKLNAGLLNDWEANFVAQFEGYTKKQLSTLTSLQYKKLRDISNS